VHHRPDPDRLRLAGIAQVLLKPCAPDVVADELRRLLRDRIALTDESTRARASQ